MRIISCLVGLFFLSGAGYGQALSMAPEEFRASRQMACVLARQSLGYLSEEEYGAQTHSTLDGFDDEERGAILAKAIGYYDGLMFSIDADDPGRVNERLEVFIASESCNGDFRKVLFRI